MHLEFTIIFDAAVTKYRNLLWLAMGNSSKAT